jgi:hypothetical protein
MTSTKRQIQIRPRLTTLHLAPRPRLPIIPINTLTTRITRPNRHRATHEPTAEEITHVAPDPADTIDAVSDNGLADVGLEDVALGVGELERDAVGDGVAAEDLAVKSVFCDGLLGTAGAADGPEVDWFVALVCYDGAANSW